MHHIKRHQRVAVWLEAVWQDVRYALRSFRRTPLIAASAIITFALGIGANTAVFSIVNGVLLRPLAYADPDRLVLIQEQIPRLGRVPAGAAEFERWRAATTSFERMALMAVAPVILTGSGEPARLEAARVSPSLFPMLGVTPAIGRGFTPDEEVPGRDRMVVLGHALWQTRFGADTSIIGRAIVLNDESYVVAGVLPSDFRFPRLEQLFVMGITGSHPQLWLPFAIKEEERGENSFAAVARLRAGVSPEQARSELRTVLAEFARQLPDPPKIDVDILPLKDQITGASRDTLALLWVSIAVVLLIACGNIASLLLTRGTLRRAELAIRGALGATRHRLLRHSLIDSLTIAAVGGLGGVIIASWSLPFLIELAPPGVPRLDEVHLDGRALLFAAAITTVTGLIVGWLPARRAAGTGLLEAVQTNARSGHVSRRDAAIRNLMVSAQVALTVVCLGGAGLVVRSLMNVLRVDSGFQPANALGVEVSLSPGRYRTRQSRATFVRDGLSQLRSIHGVIDVGFTSKLPLRGISMNTMLAAEGTEEFRIPITERPQADVRSVDRDYFRALGIPLIDGELFDDGVSRPVAVISSAMAKRVWPNERPIGKRFRLGAQPDRLVEVVGIVSDVRNMGVEAAPSQTVYVPYWQGFLNTTAFLVRTSRDPTTMATAARAAIAKVDADVPVDAAVTMTNVVNEAVGGRRFQAILLIAFATLAVILAGVGVFGVVSYAVTNRTRELGVRLALGASPGALRRLVLGHVLRLVGGGLALGLPLAVAAGYFLRTLLFGVTAYDGAALAAASGLAFVAGIAAGCWPAWRAGRPDAGAILRGE